MKSLTHYSFAMYIAALRLHTHIYGNVGVLKERVQSKQNYARVKSMQHAVDTYSVTEREHLDNKINHWLKVQLFLKLYGSILLV